MHALVTGGCGFIGSHLVDRLIGDGHQVTVLDNLSSGKREHLPSVASFVEGDVADAALVESLVTEVETIFHLAAVSSVQRCETQPELTERTNVLGTETIFAAAAKKGIPVIYASSAAVYGDNPTLPLKEHATLQPLGAYGKQKQQNELIGARYAAQVPNVGLRFFNVYGARQAADSPYSGVISKFIACAIDGIPLTFFGDGEQTRDFIYVGDVVELLMRAQVNVKGAMIFNGCTGHEINLKNLAQAIEHSINHPISIVTKNARAGDIRRSLGDPQLARERLGFDAQTSLHDGLAALMQSHA